MKNFAQARFYYRKASHLNPANSVMFYKMAYCYFKEDKFELAVKSLETALKQKPDRADYNLLMGDCKLALGFDKEAIQYFMNVVRLKPRAVAGWEALLKCLYLTGYFENMLKQLDNAIFNSGDKPLYHYYKAIALFALQKSKRGFIALEEGLSANPYFLKKIIQLEPSLLQNTQVADLIIKYKKKRSNR